MGEVQTVVPKLDFSIKSFHYEVSVLMHTCVLFPFRGDKLHDELAIAYHLVMDSRTVSKSGSAPIPVGYPLASSPPRSFSMSEEVIASIQDTPTIKKQVTEVLTYSAMYVCWLGNVSHTYNVKWYKNVFNHDLQMVPNGGTNSTTWFFWKYC